MIEELKGAWLHEGKEEQLLLFVDGYFVHTVYSKSGKKFIETSGGPYVINENRLDVAIEFNTIDNEQTGRSLAYSFVVSGDQLSLDVNGGKIAYKRIDDGVAPLTGTWHITSQLREGQVIPIHRTGTRKTLKILSATRFQWVAIDPGIKEFFGTGGGIYEFINGKYTEKIEFFSRDGSRVGASLSFDGRIENGEWHHGGFSSKGEPVYEVWSKVNE